MLLNPMILTTRVSGLRSNNYLRCPISIFPVLGSLFTYKVLFGDISSAVSYIEGCSILDIMIVSFSFKIPLNTKLFASVLPLTKNIYSGDCASICF